MKKYTIIVAILLVFFGSFRLVSAMPPPPGVNIWLFENLNSNCTRANPEVIVTPVNENTIAPGEQKEFTVTINNKSTGNCQLESYSLTGKIFITTVEQSGWTVSFDRSNITLALGQQSLVTAVAKAPSSAQTETYSLKVNASTNDGYTGNGSAYFDLVATPQTPTTPSDPTDPETPPETPPTDPVTPPDPLEDRSIRVIVTWDERGKEMSLSLITYLAQLLNL